MTKSMTGMQNKQNYSHGSGAYGYLEWAAQCPVVTFDLSTNSIGEISGSNSEITFGYECTEDLSNYNLYCMVYVEKTVSINMSTTSTYIAVR